MPFRAGVSSTVSTARLVGGVLIALGGALVIGACVRYEKSDNPLSPTIAGPLPGVSISAPHPFQPGQNSRIQSDQQPIVLMVDNASTSGPRPLNYKFDLAVDGTFSNIVLTRGGIAPGSGRTSFRLPDALASGRNYFWRARAQDGANTGPYSAVGAFMVFTPVVIGKPVAIAPANDVALTNAHPTFVIGNATRSGPVGPITYTIELSSKGSFSPLAAAWQIGEQPSQTTLKSPAELAGGTTFYWHVRASDPSAVSVWSDPQSFKTPDASGGGGGGGGGGAPCVSRLPIDIVTCHRAQYPTLLTPAAAPNLLRDIASDLNHGQPLYYGRLVKTSGNSCSGFACDIICGSDGNIWDVFIDGPDATIGYAGTALPSWNSKGTTGAQCLLVP